MRLVPRQLQRAGMTGSVPYYGGRLTPGHIQALTHSPSPQQGLTPRQADAYTALNVLRRQGVITDEEYNDLRTRVTP
jgi:hypothetical protein